MANSTSNIDAISVSQASKEVTANAFFDAASQAATYGRRASTSSGLTWGYYGGNVVKADASMAQIANGTLTLTASATSYIVAAKATGAVSAATTTTNWDNATDYWRLYSVVAGAETVTSWSDLRAIGQYTGSGSGGGGGMTNPMTTSGDLITGGASGAPGRLGVGTDGQILKVVSGAPAWTTPGAGTGVVEAIVAGTGITVDATDPANPVIAATGGGVGTVDEIIAGPGISVDSTDPTKPVITATGGGSGLDWASARVYHVGQASGMYATVAAAVTAINAAAVPPSSSNRVVIQVWPGYYTSTSVVTLPAYVGVKGVSKGLVQFYNATTEIFKCTGHNFLEDFLIEGSATAGLHAIDCNNADAVHVRRVDMLHNGMTSRQSFLKQHGGTWTVLFIEHCIVDFRATSGYAVWLQETSGTARMVDVNVNDVFFDAYGLTGYGGSFLIRGLRDVRFKRSTIRGAETYNTGIRLERWVTTGLPSIEVKHCDFANFENTAGGVSIFNETNTKVYLTNSDAPASIFSGTVVNRNSNVA